MGALVCDICGGKLVMETNGIAVCESCGMEYSKDAVKEKVQQIKGIVQIDNSNMISSWMKMGLDAAEAGNQKEAYDYFTKVIEIEPRNWRAIFEKGKAAAWQSKLGNLRISELYQAVKQANAIVDELEMSDEDKSGIKNEFLVAIVSVNNVVTDLKKQNLFNRDDLYFDLNWDDMWHTRQSALDNISKIEDAMSLVEGLDDDLTRKNIIECKKRICSELNYICGYWIYWNDYSKDSRGTFGYNASEKKQYVDRFWELVAEIRDTDPDYATTKYSQIDPFDPPARSYDFNRQDRILEHWKNIDAELKKKKEKAAADKRFKEYWETHADEKKQYEDRLVKIKEEKETLRTTIDGYNSRLKTIENEYNQSNATADEELEQLNSQISDLERQKSSLGLFAGKQKKEVQARIDQLKTGIPNIWDRIKRVKAANKADYDVKVGTVRIEMKPFTERMTTLETEERNINSELTKAR